MRLKNSFARFMGLMLMAEATTEGAPGGGATPPVTPPAPAPAPVPAPTSVLGSVPTTDFIPEKYRTNKEDGTFDLEASARKVAEAHKHLETRLGSGDAPPKTADEYVVKLETEGFNWDEFKKDESTQSFLKGAHAKGLNNDQVQYVIGEYLKAAPGLIEGGVQLTTQDCTAALKAVWTDDKAMTANVTASYRAAQAFASEEGKPGNLDSLMAKYGNDPDFIAFTANIGKELKEDSAINGGQVSEADFAVKSAELREQLGKMEPHDPKRPGIQAQLNAMYESRYNKPQSRLG